MLARIVLSVAVVLVLTEAGSGQWTSVEEAKLTASNAVAEDNLGSCVAISKDRVVVGVPKNSPGSGVFGLVGGLAFDPGIGLFGKDDESSHLISIDPLSGAVTPVGALYETIDGLAFDPVMNTLYGSNATYKRLWVIDTATGAGTWVGQIHFGNVQGLAFDPLTGTLYGSDLDTDQLIAIDTTTAAGTAIGPLGFKGVKGLEFDSTTNTLYGSDSKTDQLITINTATGMGTAVGPLGFDDVRGLALDPSTGTLYGTDDVSEQLIAIDPATGAGTTIGPLIGPLLEAGAAYVFVRNGASWLEEAKLTASDAKHFDWFGQSVALSGDTLVVGAMGVDHPWGDSGAAYVFVRNGTGWLEEAKLNPQNNPNLWTWEFGRSVSISGDTVVIGDPWAEHTVGPGAGSAYVFERSGTSWSEQAKLTASNAATYDQFGQSVAISGDRALVGAPWKGTGRAYVFERGTTGWTEQAKLAPGQGANVNQFGTSVSLTDSTAVIGAPFGSSAPTTPGSAFLFARSGTSWSQQANLMASDGMAGDEFGFSVGIEDDAAVFGAPQDDHPGADNAGSAYVFRFVPAPPTPYCTAGKSASGCAASIGATGTASATAPTGFVLTASGVEGAKAGLFLFGTGGQQANPWGSGSSFQCIVPPTKGGGLLVGSGTSGACDGFFGQDLNALWCSTCPKPNHNPGPGTAVQAQLWYRDPLSTGNQTTSYSDAIEFWTGP